MTEPRLLLANNNPGKIRELVALLEGVPFPLTTPEDEGVVLDVDETGTTFEANAMLKARAFASASGLHSLSDDSGLEIDFLDGEPGPRSARYAGPSATQSQMIEYLLGKLEGADWSMRRARFRCVIAIAEPRGQVSVFEGRCEGFITFKPHGYNGFGYDPIFYLPELGKHMAELEVYEKNQVSHRAIAAQKAVAFLQEYACKIKTNLAL